MTSGGRDAQSLQRDVAPLVDVGGEPRALEVVLQHLHQSRLVLDDGDAGLIRVRYGDLVHVDRGGGA